MQVPPATDPVWADIVRERRVVSFEFFAIKIMLGRLVPSVKRDSSPGNVARCAAELRELVAQNGHLPSCQRDLQKILGR